MKIKRYVKEFAADILKPIKERSDLIGCPYQMRIERILKELERGRMTSMEAVKSIIYIHDKWEGKSVKIDVFEECSTEAN